MKGSLCLAVLTTLALAQPTAARNPYRLPRTSLRQPDLQGVWTSNSLTRLERSPVYPAVVISAAQARAIRPPPMISPDDTGQSDSETYDAGLALARVGGDIRTAWIIDPPDGRLPFTPAGRARASKAPEFAEPEMRSNSERCLMMPSVGPPMINGLYNNNLQILQTRENLVIYLEQNHEVRIVPIGRRPHGPVPLWMGDSVGWWEGHDFVIETTNFAPAGALRSFPLAQLYLSPDAVVVERLHRVSAARILYSYTVVDPANYTQPWRGEMPLVATRGPIYEYACHEGNYSLPNILAGARAQEAAGAAGHATVSRQP